MSQNPIQLLFTTPADFPDIAEASTVDLSSFPDFVAEAVRDKQTATEQTELDCATVKRVKEASYNDLLQLFWSLKQPAVVETQEHADISDGSRALQLIQPGESAQRIEPSSV